MKQNVSENIFLCGAVSRSAMSCSDMLCHAVYCSHLLYELVY